MKKPALKPLVQKWQKKLRLQDWKVIAVYVRQEDFPGVYGGLREWDPNERTAHIIVVADPNTDGKPDEDAPSAESIILHELLHIYFPDPDGPHKLLSEQGVRLVEEVFWANRGRIRG